MDKEEGNNFLYSCNLLGFLMALGFEHGAHVC
jgi:hypothetical protein